MINHFFIWLDFAWVSKAMVKHCKAVFRCAITTVKCMLSYLETDSHVEGWWWIAQDFCVVHIRMGIRQKPTSNRSLLVIYQTYISAASQPAILTSMFIQTCVNLDSNMVNIDANSIASPNLQCDLDLTQWSDSNSLVAAVWAYPDYKAV